MPPAPKTAAAPPGRRINWRDFGAAPPADDRQTWRPSTEGDRITGRVASVKEANTKFGARVVLELTGCTEVEFGGEPAPDGDYSCWPTQGLLDSLDATGADQGDIVTITLAKLIDTGRGSPFKSFEVEVVSNKSF
jgi:hypothetical protein